MTLACPCKAVAHSILVLKYFNAVSMLALIWKIWTS